MKNLFILFFMFQSFLMANQIKPLDYQKLLGAGLDVDWSKVGRGTKYYNEQTAKDFALRGIKHVRIRIKDNLSDELLNSLDTQINDCLKFGLIPIIAYQADEFKNNVSNENMAKVISWWKTIAERYQNYSPLLSFDIIVEVTDELNKNQEKLNILYEKVVKEIRKSNPTRIIFISPIIRSSPEYLKDLIIPSEANGYLMAEFHFYASGPSKTNPLKLWTDGSDSQRAIITNKINLAKTFQEKTGIYTWVGAFMAGNYNEGNDYSIEEQEKFAAFVVDELNSAKIPYAVNSDTKFYQRENNQWIPEMSNLLDIILKKTTK